MNDFKTVLVNRIFTYLPIILCGISSIILACRSGKIEIVYRPCKSKRNGQLDIDIDNDTGNSEHDSR